MKYKMIIPGLALLFFIGCSEPSSYVLEVTTFRTKTTTNTFVFNKLDGEVEANFTSQQPGFIERQSAVNEQGEYIVLVYWNSMDEADASMNKFMKDESVAEYASMIDGASMKMSRFQTSEMFDKKNSSFIEVMSFETKEGTEPKAFKKLNKKVGNEVTAPKEGFVQRIMGMNETGR